jgi:hypothetical protein
MLSTEPGNLGYPSKHPQSAYYPGPLVITPDEIAQAGMLMGKQRIGQQNTGFSKNQRSWLIIGKQAHLDVLEASIEMDGKTPIVGRLKSSDVRLGSSWRPL